MESEPRTSFGWLILLTLFLIGVWYGLSSVVDIAEISTNWQKYRCSPSVMPFASLYGYNTSDNFNYCLKNIFQNQVGGVTGPFAGILGSMTTSLMTFLNNLNSMRIMIATLVGGITKVLQEFSDRFKLLFSQIKLTFLKIQMLMRRLFGTFQSVIYMGLSAVQVGTNFSKTFIFTFLDTFCFAPETLISIFEKGEISIDKVQLGDILSNKSKVISTYRFMADGQEMVSLYGVIVSTNHFVKFDNEFIEAKDHPDAISIDPWMGGSIRPLICLDTDNNQIPINNEIFLDWDETTDVDENLMKNNEVCLNGKAEIKPRKWIFQPAMDNSTEVKYKDGTVKLCTDVKLGDELSTGRVVGIGKRLIYSWTTLSSGLTVTPSTLIWKGRWIRAGHLSDNIKRSKIPRVFYTFTVLGANIELSTGEMMRDMCEIHSPETESLIRGHFNKCRSER